MQETQYYMTYENGTFPVPNEDAMAHLSVGCFVRVEVGEVCFWAEISEKKDDGRFTGYIRHELGTTDCSTKSAGYKKADFHRKHIVALGCDVFCSC